MTSRWPPAAPPSWRQAEAPSAQSHWPGCWPLQSCCAWGAPARCCCGAAAAALAAQRTPWLHAARQKAVLAGLLAPLGGLTGQQAAGASCRSQHSLTGWRTQRQLTQSETRSPPDSCTTSNWCASTTPRLVGSLKQGNRPGQQHQGCLCLPDQRACMVAYDSILTQPAVRGL